MVTSNAFLLTKCVSKTIDRENFYFYNFYKLLQISYFQCSIRTAGTIESCLSSCGLQNAQVINGCVGAGYNAVSQECAQCGVVPDPSDPSLIQLKDFAGTLFICKLLMLGFCKSGSKAVDCITTPSDTSVTITAIR